MTPTVYSLSRTKQKIDELVGACGVRDPDAQADVAQLCLIKAWRRGHTYRGDASFDGWLYGVVRNESLSWIRREGTRLRNLERASAQWCDRRGLADDVILDVTIERLLSELNETDRRLVELRYCRDMTSAEVGVVLGIAASSVRCRLMSLRMQLDGRGYRRLTG